MKTVNSPEYSRNYGFWNESEQEAIMSTKVAIAGVGGDGYQLGLKLARMGIQEFFIADPEVFEPENSNRVPGATTSTYGMKKTDVFTRDIKDINPDAVVHVFDEGLNERNADDFTANASMVFDESELTYLHVGTSLARAARKHKIPDILVMNVGFAAQVTSFHPESNFTFERFMGFSDQLALEEISKLSVDFSRCLPYVPRYGDLSTLMAVKEGESLPSIAPGVDVASAIGATEAFRHITSKLGNHRKKPVWAPRVRWMDAYDYSAGSTRFPRLSHYKRLAVAVTINLSGLNPEASYTPDAIKRRNSVVGNG